MTRHIPARRVAPDTRSLSERLGDSVLALVGEVPETHEHRGRTPDERAREIAAAAANKAALAAGTLTLPPGPAGWLTIVPELIAIWRIQRQMVADIAGAYGASADLTRTHMLHCLFRHAAAQALRDVGVRVGARLMIQDLPLAAIQRIAARIGVHVGRKVAIRGIARWLPLVGAVGVGGYAWLDTRQVAQAAIELFGTPVGETIEARPAGSRRLRLAARNERRS